jgi:hypothetical protein
MQWGRKLLPTCHSVWAKQLLALQLLMLWLLALVDASLQQQPQERQKRGAW